MYCFSIIPEYFEFILILLFLHLLYFIKWIIHYSISFIMFSFYNTFFYLCYLDCCFYFYLYYNLSIFSYYDSLYNLTFSLNNLLYRILVFEFLYISPDNDIHYIWLSNCHCSWISVYHICFICFFHILQSDSDLLFNSYYFCIICGISYLLIFFPNKLKFSNGNK